MYFWDEMSADELTAIDKARTDYEDRQNREEWERARVAAYWSVVAMQGNEKIKSPEELFPLKWDKKKK